VVTALSGCWASQRSQLAPASCGVSTSSMRRLPVDTLSMEWMLAPYSWTTSATSWKSTSVALERDLDVLDLVVDLR